MRNGTPLIIDIEASGFGPNGYPIEVGLALENKKRYCSLIRPHESWVDWNEDAEALHGISRESLSKFGSSIIDVTKILNEMLFNKVVYSDGWVVDEPWIIKLFAAAGIQRQFYMYDIMTILDERSMAIWHEVKVRVEQDLKLGRHRASNDAYIVQETYRRTLNIVRESSPKPSFS